MPFDFSDLNMQFMPQQDWQYGPCPQFSQPPCFCTFRPCTFRPTWCPCQTRPYSFCAVPTITCRCVSRLLTCICLSKPIASVPPKTIDFTVYEQVTGLLREVADPSDLDVLRVELQEALKQVDVHQEILKQTAGPRSDAEFDEAEKALKQQLEQLQQQRHAAKGKGEKK
jgi:hypothetical protein